MSLEVYNANQTPKPSNSHHTATPYTSRGHTERQKRERGAARSELTNNNDDDEGDEERKSEEKRRRHVFSPQRASARVRKSKKRKYQGKLVCLLAACAFIFLRFCAAVLLSLCLSLNIDGRPRTLDPGSRSSCTTKSCQPRHTCGGTREPSAPATPRASHVRAGGRWRRHADLV